jgi:signal peptidase I
MFDNNKFDSFINGIDESIYTLDKEMKEQILSAALCKIAPEEADTKQRHNMKASLIRSKRLSIYTLRSIAACLTIILIFAFIPNNPVNALCKKIFSFVPGIGVTLSQDDEAPVKAALDKPVKAENGNEFLEVRSAYIANNYLYVSITTNVGTSRISNIEDKKEVLKYFSAENMPDIYLTYNDQKATLKNFTTGSPSLETNAYNISGYFCIDKNTSADTVFTISMDSFDTAADIRLSPVKSGVTPESMGNTIAVNDIIIFANTTRDDGILTVELSSVAPKAVRDVRFYLFDDEKVLFNDSIYALDKDGNKYEPDEYLRKLNNSGINTFYFSIPNDKEIEKIVIPQVLYNVDREAQIKIRMPEAGKALMIDKAVDLGDSSVRLENASIIPHDDSLLPDEFKKFDCLKIDYTTGTLSNGSNTKILRIIPDISVPSESFFNYDTVPSSGVFSNFIPPDRNNGYTLIEFDGMEKTKKIMINLNVEFAIIGPFEMDIKD